MNTYEMRGVSSTKEEVHHAIRNLDKGLYSNAFCKIIPDLAAGDPSFCNVMHADTAGTKTALAYLYWRETGDLSVWHQIVQDAIVMNLDDMACAGCTDSFVLSSTIGRNKRLVPGEVLSALIQGTQEFLGLLRDLGFEVNLAGGETADVGDIVRVLDVGFTAFSRIRRDAVFENKIHPGASLVVISSSGCATWESGYNSGIGCNGLTSARHDVLARYYAEVYPESYDPTMPEALIYRGSRRLTDRMDIGDGKSYTVGSLLLSPTRTYLPFLRNLFKLHQARLQGIIHCTGGGLTKVLRFMDGIRIVKDNLLPVPPVFSLIQKESGTPWSDMYAVYNMGQRLELYVAPEIAAEVIGLAASLGLEATIAGRVEKAPQREIIVESGYGSFIYR